MWKPAGRITIALPSLHNQTGSPPGGGEALALALAEQAELPPDCCASGGCQQSLYLARLRPAVGGRLISPAAATPKQLIILGMRGELCL